MMTIRDLLRKKSTISRGGGASSTERRLKDPQAQRGPGVAVPQFTFVRSTTLTEEIISVPCYPGDRDYDRPSPNKPSTDQLPKRRPSLFHRRSHETAASIDTKSDDGSSVIGTSPVSDNGSTASRGEKFPVRPRIERSPSLSDRIRCSMSLSKKTSRETVNSTLPLDLAAAPESVSIPTRGLVGETKDARDTSEADTKDLRETREAQWVKRATVLALDSRLPKLDEAAAASGSPTSATSITAAPPTVTTPNNDSELQRAITLHEAGDLEAATKIFAQLSDEKRANVPLAQVLYGLSLRHGWGTPINLTLGLHYLSLAAQTSASIEAAALKAGLDRGGPAKGELVIAIFELANCFRHGWGVKADHVVARTYYETAANLGDLDAIEEYATCLVDGVGGPKDKVRAAQYLRLAESKGRKRVGNSWIYKDKYNPT